MTSAYDFSATLISGEQCELSTFAGDVLLIVNTASSCGFTPQFEALQKLYQEHRGEGFTVLGFPCAQFMNQEFDDPAKTMEFCSLNYGVTFPMFQAIDVNGAGVHPLFAWLRQETGGKFVNAIKWNFTKFLINRQGQVVKRYAPFVTPDKIIDDLKIELAR
ncbi:MAG: glutathione peroxidase [Propionibacteriaceae bacterium]